MTVTTKLFLFLAVIILLFWFFKPKKTVLAIGDKMPSFKLQNQEGKWLDSSSFNGAPLVVYFYPKDDTPGCTKEACSFRDNYEKFKENNVEVVGISADAIESHKDFVAKYNLPFILLTDSNRSVHKAFGVEKKLGVFTARITFIVDAKGKIINIFEDNINAEKHIEEALKALKIN
jgi:peroxiredoxin Q/BCP